jgi:ComF family protein
LGRYGLRGFDAAYSFGPYEGVLREWIHLYKYRRVKTMRQPLRESLAAALPREEHFAGVVPVPLHWRRGQRGFNQSELLARGTGKQCGIPILPALRRNRYPAAQAGLSNTGRRMNVATPFAVRRGQALAGKRLVLVDDGLTTGSTAGACVRVLRRAGAASVVLLTMARADRRIDFTPGHPDSTHSLGADFNAEGSIRNG